MATPLAGGPSSGKPPLFSLASGKIHFDRHVNLRKYFVLVAGVVILSAAAIAQSTPTVTAVDPVSGKVNDTVTVSGDNLGKASVSSVYLSDDKNDYKAVIVDQSDGKISMKIPQVKAGDYNISVQVGDKLFIKPVKFKVE